MNLRNIYIVCRDNYNAIEDLDVRDITINNRTMKKVTGWDYARNAAINLMKVDFLKEKSEKFIEAVPAIFVMKNSFDIANDEWSKINKIKNSLLSSINVVIELYESMGLKDTERLGVDIKLPTYHDFSEYVKYVNDIEFVLTKCPYLNVKDEKIEFSNVDVGSNWLTFIIVGSTVLTGASVVLNNLAAFVDKCIIIRSHYLTTKKQKQEIEKEEKEQKEKEIIINYINALYKRQVDMAIQDMDTISGYKMENKDGDERRRIEECFLRMGNLIDKGLQIHMSIDSPKEAQALFEPLEMKYISIAENLKMLEEKKEE